MFFSQLDQDNLLKEMEGLFHFVLDNPYSDFYKNTYQSQMPELSALDKWDFTSFPNYWQKLPFLTREEILTSAIEKLIFVPEEELGILAVSAGTTKVKEPLISIRNRYLTWFSRPLEEIQSSHLIPFEQLKIKKIIFLLPLNALAERILIFQKAKTKPLLIFGDLNHLELWAKIMQKYPADGLVTTPTIAIFFAYQLSKEARSNFRLLSLGGEYCSDTRRSLLKELYPQAKIFFRYGGTETHGLRAYQCQFLSKESSNLFHPESFYLFEAIDQNQNLLSFDQEGELVLTTLFKLAFPLIRYRSGDLVIFKKNNCPCGKELILEMRGRAQFDSFKIQGLNFHQASFEQTLASFSQFFGPDFRVRLKEIKQGEQILIKIILELIPKNIALPPLDILAQEISQKLYLSSKNTLADLVKQGVCLPLEIQLVKSHPIEFKRKWIVFED